MSTDLLREFGELDHTSIDADDHDFGAFERPATSDAFSLLADSAPLVEEDIPFDGEHVGRTRWDDSEQHKDFEKPSTLQDSSLGPLHDQISTHDWDEFEKATVLFDAQVESPSPVTPSLLSVQHNAGGQPQRQEDLGDDDFEAWSPVNLRCEARDMPALIPQHANSVAPHKTNDLPTSKHGTPGAPPSNVPPPSILLTLSVSVLQEIQWQYKMKAKITDSQEHSMNKPVASQLRAIGRIVNGRKLRWKRDNMLSQQMRIGQAGKPGGMKLTSIDKTETRREDQEAAELQRSWRKQFGHVRSTYPTLAKDKVPDNVESLPIRTGKLSEGALTAPKPCFLCGIKRDERVLKVDDEVEDSFGEFWIDHWGHRDCVDFWEDHKGSLPQR